MKSIADKRLSYLILLISTASVWIWTASTDDLTDDWWYRHEFCYNSYQEALTGFENCDGKPIDSWGQVVESTAGHYLHYGNGRLSNLLMFATNMLPTWLIDMMLALMWGLMIVNILKLISRDYLSHPLLCISIIWSTWLFLPYDDQMASTAYQINYIWTTALNLLIINILHRPLTPSSRALRTAYSIVALIAAMMHEGLSAAVGIAILIFLLQRYVCSSKADFRQYLKFNLPIIILYLTGALIVILSPAVANRLADPTSIKESLPMDMLLYKHAVNTPIIWITLLISISLAVRKGLKGLTDFANRNYIWITIFIISYATWIIIGGSERQFWIGIVALIIIDWKMIIDLFTLRKTRIFTQIVSSILTIMLVAWILSISHYQSLADKELAQISKSLRSSDSEIIYIDTYPPAWAPWWQLDIVEHYHADCREIRGYHHAFYRSGWNDAIITLPQQFKDMPHDSLPLIDGSAGLRGVFPCYYSHIKYGDREGGAWFDVTFGEIPIKEFLHGADPRYNLMNLFSRLGTEKPNRAHHIEFTRIAIPSTERDTVWYYRVTRLGRSLRSAPVVAIDSLR